MCQMFADKLRKEKKEFLRVEASMKKLNPKIRKHADNIQDRVSAFATVWDTVRK